jgi:hypothetical protein
MTFNGAPEIVALIATAFGVIFSLYWVYIAWRAMRAHERLAAAVERIATIDARRPLTHGAEGPTVL